ncbi:hypothetical protein CO010_03400 [Candidatus Shapirobacteria bacterium CG_4_8_14_3_um_filter_39_11]|uniref:Uncharacterized protein n=3 Tax=Candidatus Shapironibacteriota TaxID=1752721 RepID=A0A2M8GFU2_9BACT|nr:MAG: hypothetical protein CO010_03400 [Candidatus Shapirobacteria bacterium CG_4_8_14_3_um_filter_39_11]
MKQTTVLCVLAFVSVLTSINLKIVMDLKMSQSVLRETIMDLAEKPPVEKVVKETVVVEKIVEVTRVATAEDLAGHVVLPTSVWCNYRVTFVGASNEDLHWVTVFEEKRGVTFNSYSPLAAGIVRVGTNFPCPDKLVIWLERGNPWGGTGRSIEISLPDEGFTVVEVCLATGEVAVVYPSEEKLDECVLRLFPFPALSCLFCPFDSAQDSCAFI